MKKLVLSIILIIGFIAPLFAKELPDFTELAEKQGPSVVNVSTTQTVQAEQGTPQLPFSEDDPFYEFFKRFAPPVPREFESKSLGSGFIISSDGYILTNAHVVADADEVTVKLTDKREFKAKVIGSDRRTDVALLKIDATGLPKVTMGDPARLKVGEWVVAIGSPFGFENSVTAGIVSAKGRSLPQESFVPFIQTDVAINPGNSGGPLFNLKGEVVGINSQIYSRTGGFMGLSFAIPIDMAMDVTEQLRSTGRVSRGRIGVVIQEVTKELAESFALSKPVGALINSVEKGGPADKAGLQPSDVILKFNDKTINSSADLPRVVGSTKPGTTVNVEIWRKGASKDLTLTVGEIPPDEKVAQHPAKRGKTPESRLGMALSDLTANQRSELEIRGGILVENVQGAAARAGIRRGDIILAVNNNNIKSVEQFSQIVNKLGKGRTIALLVKRGDNALYIPLRID